MFGEDAIRVIKNTIHLSFGNIYSGLISFFVTVYIARVLGPQEYGIYNVVFAFLLFFMVLPDFGTNTILIRDGSKYPEKTAYFIERSFFLRVIMGLCAIMLCFIGCFFVPYPYMTKVLIMIASLMLMTNGIGWLFSTVFNMRQRMEYIAFIQIIERSIFAILCFIVLSLGLGIAAVVLVTVFGTFISMILGYHFTKRFVSLKLNFVVYKKFAKDLLRQGIWFGIAGIFWTIYTRIDTFMLSILGSMDDVGLYSAGWAIVNQGFLLLSMSLGTALFPLSAKNIRNRVYTKRLFNQILIATALTVAVSVAVFSFAPFIISILYGAKYVVSVEVLRVLIWVFPLSIFSIWGIQVISASGNQHFYALIGFSMLISSIILNYSLIPLLGIVGAAYAALLTQTIGFTLGLVMGWRIIKNI